MHKAKVAILIVLMCMAGVGPMPAQAPNALQDLIDAAAPGDVIVLDGGTYYSPIIDKPLTIVGRTGTRPLIGGTLPQTGIPLSASIELMGPGSGVVTLVNLDVGQEFTDEPFLANAPAIRGGGFDELRVLHCTVNTPVYYFTSADPLLENAGMDVQIPFTLIQDSEVIAGYSTQERGWFSDYVQPGAPGILSTGDIAVLDSTVRGGQGTNLYVDLNATTMWLGCDDVPLGPGGPGISTPGTVYRANTVIEGGDGAQVVGGLGDIPINIVFSCQHPDGSALEVGNLVSFDDELFLGSGPLLPNASFELTWYAGSPGSLLVIGFEPTAPQQAGPAGLLFMSPSAMFTVPVPATGIVQLPLPIGPTVGIGGVPLAFQRYTAVEGLSRPVFAAFLPE